MISENGSIRLCLLSVLYCIFPFLALAAQVEPPVKPMLTFLEPGDALEPMGMLTFEANSLALRGQISLLQTRPAASASDQKEAPQHLTISFRPLLAVPQPEGGFVVFGHESNELPGEPRIFSWTLCCARTPDGYHFTGLSEVYRNPSGPWLIEAAMARQSTTGRLFFYHWSRSVQPELGHALWGFASDDGEKWAPLTNLPIYLDHDAFGIMWDERFKRFLTGQVTGQPWRKPYSDNMGASRRRVLHMRISHDGIAWQTVNPAGGSDLIAPDSEDSPDVEFYRMQPFAYGERYVAMVDLYAASPLTPDKHGPHLTCEWWISSDGIQWRRPWRNLASQGDAPYPIKMPPMWIGREMLFWLPGQVWGVPEYRIAGIGARANTGFSTAGFSLPGKTLLLNASVPVGSGLFHQAYIQVELRDGNNNVIPGYERDKCQIQSTDDTRIPLRWGNRTGQELAGKQVSLRFHLRAARIYALAVER